MKSFTCEGCWHPCPVRTGLFRDTAVCRQCRRSYSFWKRPPAVLVWLALVVALAAPATWAVCCAPGDAYAALHGEPWRDAARYGLFGAAAAGLAGLASAVRNRGL